MVHDRAFRAIDQIHTAHRHRTCALRARRRDQPGEARVEVLVQRAPIPKDLTIRRDGLDRAREPRDNLLALRQEGRPRRVRDVFARHLKLWEDLVPQETTRCEKREMDLWDDGLEGGERRVGVGEEVDLQELVDGDDRLVGRGAQEESVDDLALDEVDTLQRLSRDRLPLGVFTRQSIDMEDDCIRESLQSRSIN